MSEYKFKEVMSKPERLAPGHRMCAGCGATIAVRAVLRALHEGDQAVIGNATGCLEVASSGRRPRFFNALYAVSTPLNVAPAFSNALWI